MNHQPLFSIPFLASRGEIDFKTFKSSTEAALLLERLKNWHERHKLKETATDAAFISLFFLRYLGLHATGNQSGGLLLLHAIPDKTRGTDRRYRLC